MVRREPRLRPRRGCRLDLQAAGPGPRCAGFLARCVGENLERALDRAAARGVAYHAGLADFAFVMQGWAADRSRSPEPRGSRKKYLAPAAKATRLPRSRCRSRRRLRRAGDVDHRAPRRRRLDAQWHQDLDLERGIAHFYVRVREGRRGHHGVRGRRRGPRCERSASRSWRLTRWPPSRLRNSRAVLLGEPGRASSWRWQSGHLSNHSPRQRSVSRAALFMRRSLEPVSARCSARPRRLPDDAGPSSPTWRPASTPRAACLQSRLDKGHKKRTRDARSGDGQDVRHRGRAAVIDDAVQICGGSAFLRGHPVERLYGSTGAAHL